MSLKITTNNVPRDIIESHQLTEKERKEFDYLDWEAIERGEDSAYFVRYRGELYSLSDFVRIVPRSGNVGPMGLTYPVDDASELSKWDGILTDSFFSGIVLRYCRDEFGRVDCERVVIGLMTS